jgi:hypothetical protein
VTRGEIVQAASLPYALGHALFTYFECGNYAKAKMVLDVLLTLADEKGPLFWKAVETMHEGRLFALTGKATDAVQKITSGLGVWRSMGAGVWMPTFLIK